MVQTPSITVISEGYNNIGTGWKEMPCFLQLIQGWESDIVYGVPTNALGLTHF